MVDRTHGGMSPASLWTRTPCRSIPVAVIVAFAVNVILRNSTGLKKYSKVVPYETDSGNAPDCLFIVTPVWLRIQFRHVRHGLVVPSHGSRRLVSPFRRSSPWFCRDSSGPFSHQSFCSQPSGLNRKNARKPSKLMGNETLSWIFSYRIPGFSSPHHALILRVWPLSDEPAPRWSNGWVVLTAW